MNVLRKRNTLTILYIVLIFLLIYIMYTFSIFGNIHKEANSTELLSCDDFQQFLTSTVVGEGWNKLVYKGTWKQVPVAYKTINEDGHAMRKCTKTTSECLQSLKMGLIEEARVLQILNHSNIVKIFGICISNNYLKKNGLLVELGEPVDSFSLVQKDFEKRLQLAKDLTSLLVYVGSFGKDGILLPDLRLQQFVTVKGHLKLCDVDDLVFGDRECKVDTDCNATLKGDPHAINVPCRDKKCSGLNDQMNVWQACRSILPYLLSFGAPPSLQSRIDKILECKESGVKSSVVQKSVLELINPSS